MKNAFIIFLATFIFVCIGCTKESPEGLVFVKGGSFKNKNSNLFNKNVSLPDFFMGKYEVTQKEWIEIMGNNPSKFKGDTLPVESVSWYDCIEYCNLRSIKNGLQPYYIINKNKIDTINKNPIDSIKWQVEFNIKSNGYRLPTEVEWEYVASGGQKSHHYMYCGSQNINKVSWNWRNCGDSTLTGRWSWTSIENNNSKTHPVGLKEPNELGIYDMSGNVREWCEEWYQDADIDIGYFRIQRGGGWIGGDQPLTIAYRGKFDANGVGSDQGFRVCRSIIFE